jgi:endonuclease YncB( thermonuclease family)
MQAPDGDTIVLKTTSGKQERIRLYGVDAPELHQRGGKAAANFAESLLRSENVSLRVMDTDQYNRIVAIVILKDGRMLNEGLVKAGHAWVYRAHCHDEPMCSSWYALER